MTTLDRRHPGLLAIESAREQLERRISVVTLFAIAVVFAVSLGFLVRGFHVFSSDFPLNDGGMFYAMTQDLQHHGYRLPEYTSYNYGDIPFTYPPLGFYAAGLIDDLTPLSLLDVFRLLPLVVTCLTVPAFYLLSRAMLRSQVAVVASVVAFALIPRSFMWLLMGGGVTRSLGFLFAILALHQAYRLYHGRKPSALPLAIAFSALTVLSHLETGWFLAFSILVFFLSFGRSRRGLVDSSLLALGTLVLTAPWWLTILNMHGLEPLQAASNSGGSVLSGGETTRAAYLGLLNVISTSEPLFPLLGVLGMLGGLALIASKRFFLPLWWVAIVLLDVRAFPTFTSIPVAMMAGVCIAEVLLPMLRSQREAVAVAPRYEPVRPLGALRRYRLEAAVFSALLVFAIAGSLLRAGGLNGESANLRGLSLDERAALTWVRESTAGNSTFLVIPDSSWETAKTAEWFPLLANRISVATVQGSEWLDNGGFRRAVAIYDHAHDCGYTTTECLAELTDEKGVDFDYVYVRKGDLGQCCNSLMLSLDRDPRYALVYDDRGASVYLKRPLEDPAVRAFNLEP